MGDKDRLKQVLERIDRFNSDDPNQEIVDGIAFPRELIYSKRLNDWVLKLRPDASEALRIAARGQHVGRWTMPREQEPLDRGGYLRWREALKRFHAKTVGGFMGEAGYAEAEVSRVREIMSKKRLKDDPETQTLEDALCLVFLETQFDALKRKMPDEKMRDVVRKTWRKMSPQGQAAALALDLPAQAKDFLKKTLA